MLNGVDKAIAGVRLGWSVLDLGAIASQCQRFASRISDFVAENVQREIWSRKTCRKSFEDNNTRVPDRLASLQLTEAPLTSCGPRGDNVGGPEWPD